MERPEEKEAKPGGGGSAGRGEEIPRHPFWSSSSCPAPAHTPSRESYFRTSKVSAALGDSAAAPVPGKPRVCSRLLRRASRRGHSTDRGWLRPQPAPGSRTSISFSRSSESKRLCRAPFQQRAGRVAPDPPACRVGRGSFGRPDRREEDPRNGSSELGAVLVRGGDEGRERPSTPAVVHSGSL